MKAEDSNKNVFNFFFWISKVSNDEWSFKMIEKKITVGNDPRLSSDKAKSARLVSFNSHFDKTILYGPYIMLFSTVRPILIDDKVNPH